MKDLVQLTGGTVVQIDTFANVVFKESLKRVFAKEDEDGFLGSSSCATLEVLPSRDIKVRCVCVGGGLGKGVSCAGGCTL
jgi:protein transport protein SEC23